MNEFARILGEDYRLLIVAAKGISQLLSDELDKKDCEDHSHEDDLHRQIVQNVQLRHNSPDLSDDK